MLEEFVRAAINKTLAQRYPHLVLPPILYARITKAEQLSDTYEVPELTVYTETELGTFKARIAGHWNEYALQIVDRFGQPDDTFPRIPGIRARGKYDTGSIVAVAMAYGDDPAIIGEVKL